MYSYKVVPNNKFENAGSDFYVQFTEGAFIDVCFNVSELEFLGEDADGNGKLSFKYDVLELPEALQLTEESAVQLEEAIGEVLQDILIKATQEELAKNENRNPDSNESPTE